MSYKALTDEEVKENTMFSCVYLAGGGYVAMMERPDKYFRGPQGGSKCNRYFAVRKGYSDASIEGLTDDEIVSKYFGEDFNSYSIPLDLVENLLGQIK